MLSRVLAAFKIDKLHGWRWTMQRTQRFRQAHHALCKLWRQKFGNGAGLEQFERLIGKFTECGLFHPFGRGINRRQRFLHGWGTLITLDTVFRVNHLRAIFSALRLTISQHASPGCQAVFHGGVKVEKAHRQDAGAVTNLAGHHATSAKRDRAVQHFAFNRGVNARQQLADGIKLRAIFVTQGEMKQQVLHGMQANLRQLAALACPYARQSAKRHGVEQAAFHYL